MKRQRGGGEPDISLPDVWRFLQTKNLSCDNLHDLSREIDRLYTIKANEAVQEYPTDLLLTIFEQCRTDRLGVRFWLSARTVSKGWHGAISKMDFSIATTFFSSYASHSTLRTPSAKLPNWSKLAQLFKFTAVSLQVVVPLISLTSLKSLHISANPIPTTELHQFSYLTQLTSLKCDGYQSSIPTAALVQLTNLERLQFENANEITDISPLTKLQHLCLRDPHPTLTHSQTDNMTRLTYLECNEPSWFLKGRGKSYVEDGALEYEGEWLDGKRHGFGKCSNGMHVDRDEYEGQWSNDKRHGRGIMKWGVGDIYQGDWKENRITGEGTAIYGGKEKYTGSWLNGSREGSGTYTLDIGLELRGEWHQNKFMSWDLYNFQEETKQELNRRGNFTLPYQPDERWGDDPT